MEINKYIDIIEQIIQKEKNKRNNIIKEIIMNQKNINKLDSRLSFKQLPYSIFLSPLAEKFIFLWRVQLEGFFKTKIF